MMTEVRLVGRNHGLKVVSLIQAIQEHAGIRLREAKAFVEELLVGRSIAVSFTDAAQADAFRELASRLGARCERTAHSLSEDLDFRAGLLADGAAGTERIASKPHRF
jgi:hypothetical protein